MTTLITLLVPNHPEQRLAGSAEHTLGQLLLHSPIMSWSTQHFLCVSLAIPAPGTAGSAGEIWCLRTPCASHWAFNSLIKCHSPTCPVHWTSEMCQTWFLLDINQHHLRKQYSASLSKEWASKQVKIKKMLSAETAFKYSWRLLIWAPVSIE